MSGVLAYIVLLGGAIGTAIVLFYGLKTVKLL